MPLHPGVSVKPPNPKRDRPCVSRPADGGAADNIDNMTVGDDRKPLRDVPMRLLTGISMPMHMVSVIKVFLRQRAGQRLWLVG